MIVAYRVPHNEGVEMGIITGPGFDSGTNLVDLYEVDAKVQSFETLDQAIDWHEEEDAEGKLEWESVPGGLVLRRVYD